MYMRIANDFTQAAYRRGLNGFMNSPELPEEGMDRTHNPEFTVLEFYAAYKDYEWMRT